MRFMVKIGVAGARTDTDDIAAVIQRIENENFGNQDIRLWFTEMVKRVPGFESSEYSNAVIEGDVCWGSPLSHQNSYPFAVSGNQINTELLRDALHQNFLELGYNLEISIEKHPHGL